MKQVTESLHKDRNTLSFSSVVANKESMRPGFRHVHWHC